MPKEIWVVKDRPGYFGEDRDRIEAEYDKNMVQEIGELPGNGALE